MAWDTGLQAPHLNIAAYPGTPLRVVAGPGTGKTFALMRRVARLLEQGAQANRILAVTFTRTAANDLVEKLAALGVPGADLVAAKTLHSPFEVCRSAHLGSQIQIVFSSRSSWLFSRLDRFRWRYAFGR